MKHIYKLALVLLLLVACAKSGVINTPESAYKMALEHVKNGECYKDNWCKQPQDSFSPEQLTPYRVEFHTMEEENIVVVMFLVAGDQPPTQEKDKATVCRITLHRNGELVETTTYEIEII